MKSDLSADYATVDEMYGLVAAFLSGNASIEQEHRLRELIRQDVGACDLYLSVVFQSSMLLDWASPDEPAEDDAKDVFLPPPVASLSSPVHGAPGLFFSDTSVAYSLAMLIVGICLTIMAVVPTSRPMQTGANLPPAVNARHTVVHNNKPVGRITGVIDCKWANSAKIPARGTVAVGQTFRLSSGLMEITYDTGAKVVLQGPATYAVESNGGFLSIGKLTGKLETKKVVSGPWSAASESNPQSPIPNPFVVHTPTATITDLGTEFGVEVQPNGDTSSYVFRGMVEVRPVASDKRPVQAIQLRENESSQVKRSSDSESPRIRRGAVDPTTFVRAEQLSAAAGASRLKPFQRWDAFSQTIRRDPSLLVYYDFQRDKHNPSVLRNVASNDNRSLDGIIVGAAWSDGPFPGKDALQFNATKDEYVQLRLMQKSDSLTLAAWVSPYSLSSDLNALVASNQWGKAGQVHWHLDSSGGMAFGVFGEDERSQKPALALDPRHPFKWTHLAAVYDHTASKIRYYARGRKISEIDYAPNVPICIGKARIGQWNGSEYTKADGPNRLFHGQIGELAIFGRALNDEEIRCLCEGVRPIEDNNITEKP